MTDSGQYRPLSAPTYSSDTTTRSSTRNYRYDLHVDSCEFTPPETAAARAAAVAGAVAFDVSLLSFFSLVA